MRTKEQRVVITFHTTTEAMAAEKFMKQQEMEGRLIPVPRQISSGCGLAWSAPATVKEEIGDFMKQHNLGFESMGEYLI